MSNGEWKDIPGFDGEFQASACGKIRSISKPVAILTTYRRGHGYRHVIIDNKNFYVHRLVAKTFVSNPENKPQVNHINGNKSDNRAENLEWMTPRENMLHAVKNGLRGHCGESACNVKLSRSEVLAIREKHRDRIKIQDIAEAYGVHKKTIEAIVYRYTWKHL